jgi:hypothetical protein
MHVSVSFAFEAESMDDAKEIVATWTVTPGVTLLGMSGIVEGLQQAVPIMEGGTIGGHLLVTAQRSPEYQMAATQPPA